MNGSLTIEASLIYPLTIILSIFSITYCFYCHDKVTTKSNAYTVMVKNHYAQNESYNHSQLSTSLNNSCLLTNKYTYSYNKTKNTLIITDKYGYSSTISFSSLEKCDYIRQNYCLIKLLLKNQRKETSK